jgi:cytochrome P450
VSATVPARLMQGAPSYDPADPETLRDPYPVFARMREYGPVHWSDALAGWLVIGWDEVQHVVTTPTEFSAARIAPMFDRLAPANQADAADVLRWLTIWMVFQDPPQHTRVRRHMMNVISPRTVARLRDAVETITTQLLDELPRDEPFDFYSDFGLKLPGCVVMDLLGVPRDRLHEVKSWSDEMMLFIGSSRGVKDKYARARHGAQSMAGLFRELIQLRKKDPQDDVLTQMITSEVAGESLTDDELVASMMMIANGAQETTAHLLSNSLITLRTHSDAMAALRANPDGLMATAVEEFLRYDAPVLSTARLVSTDTELGGKQVLAGERVFALLAAANRDPSVFTDPDSLDLTRKPNKHLAFSSGVHFCLGAPLARMEAQIALGEIVGRFPDYQLAAPIEEIPWTNSLVARGPTRLPLQLS